MDDNLETYREEIKRCVMARMGDDADEERARLLVSELSDEELADGMPFNTPDDVAEVLVEWDPDK